MGFFSVFKKILDPGGVLSGNFNTADALDPGGAIIKEATGSDIGRRIADPGKIYPKSASFGDPAPAIAPPAVTDPDVEEARRKERELNRRRRGRESTILTGPSGLPENSAKNTLLGG